MFLDGHNFQKNGGHFVISIKASCIDSTAEPAAVFAAEVNKMKTEKMKPREQLTLEPFERDHAVVVGEYRCVLLSACAVLNRNKRKERDEPANRIAEEMIGCARLRHYRRPRHRATLRN